PNHRQIRHSRNNQISQKPESAPAPAVLARRRILRYLFNSTVTSLAALPRAGRFSNRCRKSSAVVRVEQEPEVGQHGEVEPAGASPQPVAMVAVVLLEDVVDPLAGQGARQISRGKHDVAIL